MKLCKDCKHYYFSYSMVYPSRCTHLVRDIDRSIVDGHIIDLSRLIECNQYRAEVSHIENKCGTEGKHFENKYISKIKDIYGI
jgi:hypothetical protein